MTSTQPYLRDLPRQTLSIILAYLQQPTPNDKIIDNPVHNKDGLSLLLTNKRFTYAILPLFRVPKHLRGMFRYYSPCCNSKEAQQERVVIEKYRFMVLPVQDPITLLDRLNTRRLRKRIIWMKKLAREQISSNQEEKDQRGQKVQIETGQKEQKDEACFGHENSFEVECEKLSSEKHANQEANERSCWEMCYHRGRTIGELALEEWAMMEIRFREGLLGESPENVNGSLSDSKSQWRIWPAHLELLRFVDDDNFYRDEDMAQKCQRGLDHNGRSKTHMKLFSSLSFKRKLRAKTDSGGAAGLVGNHRNNSNDESIGSSLTLGRDVFGGGVTLLASYPRSGNTLLRTLLERILGFVTGSDTRPDRTLSRSLAQEHDLVGEGLVGSGSANSHSSTNSTRNMSSSSMYDPQVRIVKTHFPERKGWKPVHGNRVLLLVRNPYDAIDSYWNLCCTNTHTCSLDESVYRMYSDKFEKLARHEIEIWCEFHYYWIDICEREGVPLLLVRFEDLVLDTVGEMKRILKFLMRQIQNEHDINDDADFKLDPFWECRINHVIGQSTVNNASQPGSDQKSNETQAASQCTSNLGSYRPRSSGGGLLSIGKTLRKNRYSDKVLLHMHDVAVSLELARKHKLAQERLEMKDSWKNLTKVLKSSAASRPTPTESSLSSKHPISTLLQRFGYDIYNQHFPESFLQQSISLDTPFTSRPTCSIEINKTPEIRSKDDPYGRMMSTWRRGETEGDTKPFPTKK